MQERTALIAVVFMTLWAKWSSKKRTVGFDSFPGLH